MQSTKSSGVVGCCLLNKPFSLRGRFCVSDEKEKSGR